MQIMKDNNEWWNMICAWLSPALSSMQASLENIRCQKNRLPDALIKLSNLERRWIIDWLNKQTVGMIKFDQIQMIKFEGARSDRKCKWSNNEIYKYKNTNIKMQIIRYSNIQNTNAMDQIWRRRYKIKTKRYQNGSLSTIQLQIQIQIQIQANTSK